MEINIDISFWYKDEAGRNRISEIRHIKLDEDDIIEFAKQKFKNETSEYHYEDYDLKFSVDKIIID